MRKIEKIWENVKIQRYLWMFLISIMIITQCTQVSGADTGENIPQEDIEKSQEEEILTIDTEEKTGNDLIVLSTGIIINDTFSDGIFRNYIASNFDDGDGILTDAEQQAVTSINVANLGVADLSGITCFSNLQSLDCSYNNLTSLDVSGCAALTSLMCHGNQLTSLNVTGCTNLEKLSCSMNQLTSLDVSGFTKLAHMNCADNQLESLNVSGCTSLVVLGFSRNPLIDLNMSGCARMGASIGTLDVSAYTTLKNLDCNGNGLTGLNISGLTALKKLDCSNNSLTSLNASNLNELKVLRLSNNPIVELDVCQDAALEELSVNSCTELETLKCSYCNLTSLDISGCSALKVLDCDNNRLTDLDVSGSSQLTSLMCHENQLTSLNVTGCTNLEKLSCSANQLTSLNVNDCTLLADFSFSNNPLITLNAIRCTSLGTLDVSDCSTLTTLNCQDSLLTSLIVRGLGDLQFLGCFGNQLTSLDTSGLVSLQSLHMSRNQITSLNLTDCISLSSLRCQGNKLVSLDVSGCLQLETLKCDINELTALNIRNNVALKTFCCSNNQLSSLDVSQNVNLQTIDCSYNQLTSLDLSNQINLTEAIAAGQAPEPLEMGYDGSIWRDSSGKVFVFGEYEPNVKATKFYKDSTMNTELTFYVSAQNGQVVATEVLPVITPIYFESKLRAGSGVDCVLQGSINYRVTLSDVSMTADSYYIDKNDVGNLPNDASALAGLFVIKINGSVAGNDMTFISACPDYADIKSGKLGSYQVSLVYNEISCITTIEVGLNINTDHFSDQRFCDYLKNNKEALGQNKDGFFTAAELNNVTRIEAANHAISSMDGLEYFKNLEYLSCSDNALTDLNVSHNQKLKELYCDNNQLKALNVTDLTLLEKLSCAGNQLTTLVLDGLTALQTVDASGQEIEELLMSFQTSDSVWRNTGAGVRTFHSCIHEFKDTSTLETLTFAVDTTGILKAQNILPIVNVVSFKGNLSSDPTKTWTLSGTFSYAADGVFLAANNVTVTTDQVKTVVGTSGAMSDLKQLKGLLGVTPKISEVEDAVVISMDENDFTALCNGTGGSYTYKAVLKLSNTSKLEVTGVIKTFDLIGIVQIPATISLTKNYTGNYAEAEEAVKLVTTAGNILGNTSKVKVTADASFDLNLGASATEKLSVDVYIVDSSGNAYTYNGTTPLATLDKNNITEQKFQLRSANLNNLTYGDYEGTMKFAISYEE